MNSLSRLFQTSLSHTSPRILISEAQTEIIDSNSFKFNFILLYINPFFFLFGKLTRSWFKLHAIFHLFSESNSTWILSPRLHTTNWQCRDKQSGFKFKQLRVIEHESFHLERFSTHSQTMWLHRLWKSHSSLSSRL